MTTKTKKTLKKKLLTAAQKAQQVANEIKRRTQQFKAASPAQKRVLIAKDVIAQIKAKRYKAQPGTWINADCGKESFDSLVMFDDLPSAESYIPCNASVQKLFLNKTITTCSCCALGSMMMSCTLYSNKQTAEDLWNESDSLGDKVLSNEKLSNGLNRYFSRKQLELIEIAFEGRYGYFGQEDEEDTFTKETYDAALLLSEVYFDPKDRLMAIMENIIENKGTFKP